jgi:hypothetical protein
MLRDWEFGWPTDAWPIFDRPASARCRRRGEGAGKTSLEPEAIPCSVTAVREGFAPAKLARAVEEAMLVTAMSPARRTGRALTGGTDHPSNEGEWLAS